MSGPEVTDGRGGLLSRLYFGRDDAETDIATGGLLRQGFLETAAYQAAKQSNKTLIVGRRGSGKSAICMMLANSSTDRETVLIVKPDDMSAEEIRRFELPGIPTEQSMSLLWRYVLTVKVAKFLVMHTQTRHRDEKMPDSIRAVRRFLIENGEADDLSFQEKFWKVIERLKASISLEAFGAKFAAEISAPSDGIRASTEVEIIEQNVQRAFRDLGCEKGHAHLLLLVDRLDEIWSNDPGSGSMVIGLLLASKRISALFGPVDSVVLVSTDIYEALRFQASAKFRSSEMRIDWKPNDLLELVLVRAQVSVGTPIQRHELWREVFPEAVAGEPTPDYLVRRTLLRPRDIIQFCNACRDTAEKNGHRRIHQEDVQEATIQYSNWKLQDLVNEYIVSLPFLNELLLLFQSGSFISTRSTIEGRLDTIRGTLQSRYSQYSAAFSADDVLDALYAIGFLGIIRDDRAIYTFESQDKIQHRDNRFVIHPCFRDALRSTSSIAVGSYEPSAVIPNRPARGLRPDRVSLSGTSSWPEWSSELHFLREAIDVCASAETAVIESRLPEEIRLEVHRNVEAIKRDIRLSITHGPASPTAESLLYDVRQRALRFFRQLQDRMSVMGLLEGGDSYGGLRAAIQGAITALRADPAARHDVRISLWGAPGSGKTTFLAALWTAALHSSENGKWLVTGTDETASEFMVRNTGNLLRGQYPHATQLATHLSWRFVGDLAGTKHDSDDAVHSGRFASRRVDFVLELNDVPGSYFALEEPGGPSDDLFDFEEPGGPSDDPSTGFIEYLAQCTGMVYMFDPIREMADRSNFEYFQHTLERVAQWTFGNGRYRGTRLPHYLAVCVTKLDDPRIFDRALQGHWIAKGPDGAVLPRIEDDRAAAFFDWICREAGGSDGHLIRAAIRSYFEPDRVAYFATSSIGFRVDARGSVDLNDYSNVEIGDGPPRIREVVRPVNVLEPLIWLERQSR